MSELAGFFSYTRFDDTHHRRLLSGIRQYLETEVRALTAMSFQLFQDIEDVQPGDRWAEELARALDDAQVLIPVVTPSFLASVWCRREVLLFLEREKDGGLARVFPIYLTTCPEIESGSSEDELVRYLTAHQWTDVRRFRHDSTVTRKLREVLEPLTRSLAESFAETVETRQVIPSEPAHASGLPAYQASTPSVEHVDLLLSEITSSPEALVEAATRNELNSTWLDDLEEHARSSSKLDPLRTIATNANDYWQRQLAAWLAERLAPDSCDIALDIAFHGPGSWGQRTTALAWLRYASGTDRGRLASQLSTMGRTEDFDHLRLRVLGLGFLGQRVMLRDIEERERVQQSSYANEKLGPYLVQAYLDSYLYHSAEALGSYDLHYLSSEIESCKSMGHYHFHTLDHLNRTGTLRPGLAKPLIDVALEADASDLAQAVLIELQARPNPHMLDMLATLARTESGLAMDACRAISAIPRPSALTVLDALVSEGVAGAEAARVLAWGYRMDDAYVDEVAAAAFAAPGEHGPDDHSAWYAAWSLGQLAGSSSRAANALHRAAGDSEQGLVRAVALAGLAKRAMIDSSALRDGLEFAESYPEQVIIGTAGAWLGDAEALAGGLLAAIRNWSPVVRLESHLSADAVAGLRSQSVGPFSFFASLAERPDVS
jgi:hypothetical protein